MKLITDYLDETSEKYPDKTAFIDEAQSVTYSEFVLAAKRLATRAAYTGNFRKPVAVYMNRSVFCLEAMFAVAYSGNFYIVIDSQMPKERIENIFGVLDPALIITESGLLGKARDISFGGEIIVFEEARSTTPDFAKLDEINKRLIDTDILYCLFTSGSTGVPKGTVLTHKNVIEYSRWAAETFGINDGTVFGNQTPFYFSMSVTDIFSTIRTGASLAIIPKQFFAFPAKLVEFMNHNNVNTIYWVPSALRIAANMNLFKYVRINCLEKILFAGEVMPVKQLNYWIRHFPDALFANLYGPTETTDICTYYVVNREFPDDSTLPIGNACDNCDVFIVNDDGKECAKGEMGELYARGSFLAQGYYNNPEKTAAAFVQNPLNKAYPETVYKTGDIVKYNELGEIIYIGRKDFQIKHMGYRIELGEIEAAISAIDGVMQQASLYDKETDNIVVIYEGKASKEEILVNAANRLPSYMMPTVVVKTQSMPHNDNGKIDRSWLGKNYKTLIGEIN